jgi:hypothetical protein
MTYSLAPIARALFCFPERERLRRHGLDRYHCTRA